MNTVEDKGILMWQQWKKENPFFFVDHGWAPSLDHFLIKAILEHIDRPPKRKGKK